jgi:hypothetical protein
MGRWENEGEREGKRDKEEGKKRRKRRGRGKLLGWIKSTGFLSHLTCWRL